MLKSPHEIWTLTSSLCCWSKPPLGPLWFCFSHPARQTQVVWDIKEPSCPQGTQGPKHIWVQAKFHPYKSPPDYIHLSFLQPCCQWSRWLWGQNIHKAEKVLALVKVLECTAQWDANKLRYPFVDSVQACLWSAQVKYEVSIFWMSNLHFNSPWAVTWLSAAHSARAVK